MTDPQRAELLLWDFATRAQEDEERAYREYRKFLAASEKVMEKRVEHRLRKVQ